MCIPVDPGRRNRAYRVSRAASRVVANLVFGLLLFAVTIGFARPAAATIGDLNENGETNLGDWRCFTSISPESAGKHPK